MIRYEHHFGKTKYPNNSHLPQKLVPVVYYIYMFHSFLQILKRCQGLPSKIYNTKQIWMKSKTTTSSDTRILNYLFNVDAEVHCQNRRIRIVM